MWLVLIAYLIPKQVCIFSFLIFSVECLECLFLVLHSYLCQSPLKLSLFPRSFAERQMSLHLLFFSIFL
ncbi:hypothetical protein RIF29_29326 [Crotalaria pallida]|uniref:Uncharacterized protein n=1 Tax=Crotalaria pallida TaxID=3830 RepID=A0AAN9EEE3_CROPI